MEASLEDRKQDLLNECSVTRQVFDPVMPRLERFMEPFVATRIRREHVDHAYASVQGPLSDLENKNAESIAYRFGCALVDIRRFLPLEWTKDKQRRERAGMPKQVCYRTRHRLYDRKRRVLLTPEDSNGRAI
jgi:hypothetical protein